MKIILASGSPRRKELLEALGFEVTCIPSKVEEICEKESTLSALEMSKENARLKAHKVFDTYGMLGSNAILAADTVVFLGAQKFGKPACTDDAKKILLELSGKTHHVVTSFHLIGEQGKAIASSVVSKVTMRNLSQNEIDAYVRTGDPMDKAGAYAVSGLGASIIDTVHGSISAIVGLPMKEVRQAIEDLTR